MFDFYKIYSTYTNTELLKIISRPDLYQPAAVTAAEKIIEERNVSQEERSSVANEIAATIHSDNKPDAVSRMIRATSDAIRYMFTPSTSFDVRKWNYWLCTLLVLTNIYWFTNGSKFLFNNFRCDDCLHWVTFMTLFSLLYFAGMIVLLLLRHRLGWIMLIASCSYEIISEIYMIFAIKYYPERFVQAIVIIAIYGLLLRFLAKPRIVIHFKGNYRLFSSALAAGVIFAILFWISLSFQM